MTIESTLRERLVQAFQPEFIEVTNESHMHNVPLNSETHFKVVAVSQVFANTRKVARHQRVYALVGDLLEGELHALALHLMTPEEWQEVEKAPSSPKCHGGE